MDKQFSNSIFLFYLTVLFAPVELKPLSFNFFPEGGTHIFGRTGMCVPLCSNGSFFFFFFFYKKYFNMPVPVLFLFVCLFVFILFLFFYFFLFFLFCFYQNILNHGSTFLTEPKFSGFRMAKIAKFLKNWPIFQEKSLKMGTLFCQGFWGSSGISLSNSNLSTPPGAFSFSTNFKWVVYSWRFV